MKHTHSAIEAHIQEAAQQALRALNRELSADANEHKVDITIAPSQRTVSLPRPIAELLREILVNIASGRAVSVIPQSAELTTQQAADLLNVSRPHVVKLINEGTLPGHKVGSHRRVYAADVQALKHQRHLEHREAADALTALSDEMGLYQQGIEIPS